MIYRVSAHFKELFKMKILVIVDMQNDFINGALGTPEAQAAVGDVAKKISGFDGNLICITKDTHRSADYLKTQEGQLLPVEHCIEGTHGWRLDDIIATAISHAAIDAGKSVSVFQKGTFGSVELGDYLVELSARMKQRIEEIVLLDSAPTSALSLTHCSSKRFCLRRKSPLTLPAAPALPRRATTMLWLL